MKSIPGQKLCKVVERKGWILKKVTGSHHIYEKSNEDKIISIPDLSFIFCFSTCKMWDIKLT